MADFLDKHLDAIIVAIVALLGEIAFRIFFSHKPAPNLKFTESKAEWFITPDNKRITEVYANIWNEGEADAYIEDILFNGVSPKNRKAYTINNEPNILVYDFKISNMRPGGTVFKGEKGWLRMNMDFEKPPKKINIKIIASGKAFKKTVSIEKKDPPAIKQTASKQAASKPRRGWISRGRPWMDWQ